MSVTFSIESNLTGAHELSCFDGTTETRIELAATSFDTAYAEGQTHEKDCETCGQYGLMIVAVRDISEDFDVNLSNVNARMILAILGIPVEAGDHPVGQMTGEQFLGHVLLGLAQDRDDTGIAPARISPEGSGATVIDAGLRPGYFAATLDRLHALASEAARLGRDVYWS